MACFLSGSKKRIDEASGRKAVPVRPISGIDEANIETTENEIKSLLGHVHPKPVYHLLQDKIDDRFYVILAVEPGNDGPYETDQRAEKDKKINLKAGRYIRIRRDSRMPNRTEEFARIQEESDKSVSDIGIENGIESKAPATAEFIKTYSQSRRKTAVKIALEILSIGMR